MAFNPQFFGTKPLKSAHFDEKFQQEFEDKILLSRTVKEKGERSEENYCYLNVQVQAELDFNQTERETEKCAQTLML